MEQPEPSSTSHSSDDHSQPELTDVAQNDASPPPSPQITSPLLDSTIIDDAPPLSFPTLSPDGSLDDLSAIQSSSYEPTPPAALSRLGRRNRMPRTDLTDSTSSLDEIQYDMVDDASDFSNDDRETASLASTERGDGHMTPDEDSIIDTDEEREDLEASDTLHGSYETIPGCRRTTEIDEQTRAENDLLDSYMSDTLQTPLQPRIRGHEVEQSPTGQSTASQETTPTQTRSSGLRRINVLFVSERDVGEEEVTTVCRNLAACLATTIKACPATAVKLPPTPSGSNRGASMFIIAGEIELLVEHCVYALDTRFIRPQHTPLYIRTSAGERTAIYSARNNERRDVEVPNIAVYYLSNDDSYPAWFNIVKRALADSHVVSMILAAPESKVSVVGLEAKGSSYPSDIIMHSEDFFNANENGLYTRLESLLTAKAKSRNKSSSLRTPEKQAKDPRPAAEKPTYEGWRLLIQLILMSAIMVYFIYVKGPDRAASLAVRRVALSDALIQVTNSTQAAEIFNVSHLLPEQRDSPQQIFCDMKPPGMVISLPPKANGHTFSSPTHWKVQRNTGHDLPNNVTRLIDGIYYVSIPADEAFGTIRVNFLLKNPLLNGTCEIAVGNNRMLQRNIMDKVDTALSNIFSKDDVAMASEKAKSLKDKLTQNFAAGAAASKNVTSQLAVYAARELSVYAHSGASLFERARQEAPAAMEKLSDRLGRDARTGASYAQRSLNSLYEFGEKSLQTTSQFTKDLTIPAKKALHESLSGARHHALNFKDRLSGLKKNTNSTSATKELSLRLQNLWKQTEKGERAGSLKDIATCVRADDYLACRREQRKKAKSLSAYKPPGALAKMPDAEVLKEAVKEKQSSKEWKAKPSSIRPTNTDGPAQTLPTFKPFNGGKGKRCRKGMKKLLEVA